LLPVCLTGGVHLFVTCVSDRWCTPVCYLCVWQVVYTCVSPVYLTGNVSPVCYVSVWQVVPVTLQLITAVSAVRLYIPSDLRPVDNRMSVLKAIQVNSSQCR